MNDDGPPKCPVCRSVFVRPRMYECGHSICEACMVGIDEYTERYFSELPNYKCPCCRKETVVPWHRRPINQALESICQAYPEYEARQQDAVPNDYETPKNIQATDLATMASTERRRIAKEQYQALLPTLYEAAKMGSPSVVISCRKTVDIVSRVIDLFSKHLFDNNKIHRVLVAKDELTIDLVRDTTVVHEYVNPLHEDLLDEVVAAPVVPESVASTFRRLSRRLELGYTPRRLLDSPRSTSSSVASTTTSLASTADYH